MVAAEVPLRGKLRAEATTFSTYPLVLQVPLRVLASTVVQGLILCCHARIAPCSTRGTSDMRKLQYSAGCVAATSNPAARAARAVPTPTRIVLFGASRREIPLAESVIIVWII